MILISRLILHILFHSICQLQWLVTIRVLILIFSSLFKSLFNFIIYLKLVLGDLKFLDEVRHLAILVSINFYQHLFVWNWAFYFVFLELSLQFFNLILFLLQFDRLLLGISFSCLLGLILQLQLPLDLGLNIFIVMPELTNFLKILELINVWVVIFNLCVPNLSFQVLKAVNWVLISDALINQPQKLGILRLSMPDCIKLQRLNLPVSKGVNTVLVKVFPSLFLLI